MALSNLSISYDISPPVYFPGKPITGKINFTISDPLPFDHVQIQLYGAVNTRRSKTATSTSGFSKNILFTASEICCDQTKTVLDGSGGSGGQNPEIESDRPVTIARKTSALKPASTSVLKPGTYSFPFTFFLSLKCPSSFEGSYGNIRYFCKTSISGGGAVRFSRKEPFTVIGWMDLNYSPTACQYFLTEASTTTDEKGGKLLTRLLLKKQGYVPGEMVEARMEIVNNNSPKSISVIFAQFVQRIMYAAKRENLDDWNKWEERRILQQATRKEKVAAKKNSSVHWDVFAIPPCCPTMIIDATILRVQYEIQFHLVFDHNAPGLNLVAPIIIGSLPMKRAFDDLRMVRLRGDVDGNIHSGAYLPLTERYPDLPLPTYKPQSDHLVDIREPSDLIFMPEAITFAPMSVFYDNSKLHESPDGKRSRKESNDAEKRPTRSRSTLSLNRFSFRGSSDNLAESEKPKEPEKPKKSENKKKDEEKEKEKENKTKSESAFKKWTRRKTVGSESEVKKPAPKSDSKEKSKKGKNDPKTTKVEDKGTQEPPVENGTMTEGDVTSGGEEEFF